MAHGEPSRGEKRRPSFRPSPGRGGRIVIILAILSPLPWLRYRVPWIVPRLGSPWATISRPLRGSGRNWRRYDHYSSTYEGKPSPYAVTIFLHIQD